MYIRDPLILFPKSLTKDDTKSTDIFDSVQGSNWPTIRFKPASDKRTGWRIEFRTMEVQMTDFENAACAMFVDLLSRAILECGMNVYVPISRVDENMARAQKRDAVRQEKFWFRNWDRSGSGEGECEEMTMDEIVNGKVSRVCFA
jgi:glutamate--cysteine ligase catalytic subunit